MKTRKELLGAIKDFNYRGRKNDADTLADMLKLYDVVIAAKKVIGLWNVSVGDMEIDQEMEKLKAKVEAVGVLEE